MRHQHPTTKVAILGADTVVGRALRALLEGFGYQIAPIDSHPTADADGLLDGADLLLLVPRLDAGAGEAFLGAIGESATNADMPVIALFTPLEKVRFEGAIGAPWTRETGALVERIEAALAEAPPRPAGGEPGTGVSPSGRENRPDDAHAPNDTL